MSSIIPFRPRAPLPPGAANLASGADNRCPAIPYSALGSPQNRFDRLFDPVAFLDEVCGMDDRLRRRLLHPAFEREQGQCFWCGRSVSLETRKTLSTSSPDPLAATVDHIIPKSQKGPNVLGNVVLACFACNTRRGDADAEAFLYEQQLDVVREALA